MAHCVLQQRNNPILNASKSLSLINVVLRYSISESLGYFTEIADDAQLFLRLRGIDKSVFIDNWKIMSIFIVDMKLKKKTIHIYIYQRYKKIM